ncbi:hypothetical protein V6N13_070461 [Hibiscus sabdariffa]|uniref:Uncharacterized protein n=1 Tax=Hibiscus sabdariffa TaxID=183260 RepID=A0ABR2TGT8_9ROSI
MSSSEGNAFDRAIALQKANARATMFGSPQKSEMKEETREKIKKTVTEILKRTTIQMTEYQILQMASWKLGFNLYEPQCRAYVNQVVGSFSQELKAKHNAHLVSIRKHYEERNELPSSKVGSSEGGSAQIVDEGIVYNSLNAGTQKRRSVRDTGECSTPKQQRVKPAVAPAQDGGGSRALHPLPLTIRTTAESTSVPAVQHLHVPFSTFGRSSIVEGVSGTVAIPVMVAPTASNISSAPVMCKIPRASIAPSPAVSMPPPGFHAAAGNLPVPGSSVVAEQVGVNEPYMTELGALLSKAQDQWRMLSSKLGPMTEEIDRLTDALELATDDAAKWQEKALEYEHEVRKWQAVAVKADAAVGKAESETLSFKSRLELLEVENKTLESDKKELKGQLDNLRERHNQDAIRIKELLELLKQKDEAMKEQLVMKDVKLRQRNRQIVKLNKRIDGFSTLGPNVRDSTICTIQLLHGPLDLVGVNWQCCWNAVMEGLKFDVMEPSGDNWTKFRDDMRDKALQPPVTPQVEVPESVSEDEDPKAL